MNLENLFVNPLSFLWFILALLLAIDVHEAAHAYMAFRLGDPTAKLQGRMSLNPLVHLDPLGTLALFLFRFGWGKPVPVNPHNLKKPGADNFKIALAGPLANLLTALLFSLVFRLTPETLPYLQSLWIIVILLNIVLMLFNLLPIPPLDGSKVLHLFLSNETYYEVERLGPFILLAILFLSRTGAGFLSAYLDLGVNFFLGILI